MRFSFSFTAAEDRPLRRQVVYAAAEPQPECSVHPIALLRCFWAPHAKSPAEGATFRGAFSHFCSGF